MGEKLRNNREVLGVDYGFDVLLQTVAEVLPNLSEQAQAALDDWRGWA